MTDPFRHSPARRRNAVAAIHPAFALPPGAAGPRRGVTLIELLIAVSLVGLLSLGLLLAMRVGLSALERTNAQMMANRRVVGAERALTQQVAGLIPMLAPCGLGPGQSTRALFFQGEPQAMRFVSSYSLAEGSRGLPRILEYLVISGREGRGLRLVVNEIPYQGPLLLGSFCAGIGRDPATGQPVAQFRPVEAGPGSFILADSLSRCRFLYLFVDARSGQPIWAERWVWQTLPKAIRLEMEPLERNLARIQVAAMTLPVEVTRNPAETYADIDLPTQ